MKELPVIHRKLLLVCTNERLDGRPCCAMGNAVEIHKKLKEVMKLTDPTIRVSKTGCLDRCSEGPTVVLMPDNKWFGGVTEEDIPAIVQIASQS